MAEASGSSKRRRTSPIDGIVLRDLPNEALCYAASFLSAPSKVLFAIALSDDDASKAIIQGEQWDVLDFGGAGDSLAAKITDGLLQELLLCIGANTKLRKLKLAGCVNITGAGLDPLRGSPALEQIDLSLVAEHKSPVLDPEPLISCEHVLPILDSIIERDDNVLQSIVFPKSWREEVNLVLNEFMERCNRACEARNITCTECDILVEDTEDQAYGRRFPLEGEYYGIQAFTCYTCLKHFCYDCEDNNGKCLLKSCEFCNRDYCRECAQMGKCGECGFAKNAYQLRSAFIVKTTTAESANQ